MLPCLTSAINSIFSLSLNLSNTVSSKTEPNFFPLKKLAKEKFMYHLSNFLSNRTCPTGNPSSFSAI